MRKLKFIFTFTERKNMVNTSTFCNRPQSFIRSVATLDFKQNGFRTMSIFVFNAIFSLFLRYQFLLTDFGPGYLEELISLKHLPSYRIIDENGEIEGLDAKINFAGKTNSPPPRSKSQRKNQFPSSFFNSIL